MNKTIIDNAIPIFFSTDDNYIPFLNVTIKSLIDNATIENFYKIIVLNTGLKQKNIDIIKKMETDNVEIEFKDVSKKVKKIEKELEYRLRDYYSASIYYRLFIPNLFPEYKKGIYLDCDIILMTDIANLYKEDLKDNFVGAVTDGVVESSEIFRNYSRDVLGLDYKKYFNSGMLLMNLDKFRKEKIEEKFLYLLCTYNFDTIAPDQDYLNVLCKDKVLYLNKGWDKMPMPDKDFDEKDLKLIHFNMFQKPWLYDNVMYDKYFWEYAKKTEFYTYIRSLKDMYTEKQKENDIKSAEILLNHAKDIAELDITFKNIITSDFVEKFDDIIKNESGNLVTSF